MRELIEQLKRVQSETGDAAGKARQELSALLGGGELKPAKPAAPARRAKKAGRKKR